MKLLNKTTIITGGARGIGRATALKFANEGARVVVADLNAADVRSAVQELEQTGAEVLGVQTDVCKYDSVNNLMERVLERFGSVDVVINNAGITQDALLTKMTEDEWDQVMNVNLKGVFIVAQAAAKIMKAKQSGVILNASSVVGTFGNFGQSNYAASKWGVNGMTKTWAKELARYNVRVNAIAPGFISTPMVDKMPEKVLNKMKENALLKRLGSPEDVANGYAFLASDDAKFITGTILSIDGGVTL
ncbi:3-oxoacyl-[acyl-carrier-protein] reductase [Geomicrobium sp. JCM 19039]|uniref:3-oxoacyl-[acyl-carrier-protein] reductase n=1 Tax=Geomicrobium sp. JCM 19039 TaxID=1460636 RepID=UPI00045F30D2|nr:3-oxoacyl-[acyl-carrier-protein] reductase [Geomicrobium sp. JCM 19039]GAK11779.1 3-oxoacyl-[acyl-carrier protein] reductase [Geomicrobium sp. JCM 19039]